MSDPVLSICIPSYHQERFIGKAIESALKVNVPQKEILVLDDASEDKTAEIATEFMPQVRVVVSEKNIGMVENWNRCMSEAKGEYVLLLCGDDEVDPDFVPRAMQVLETNPEVGLVSGKTIFIDELGRPEAQSTPLPWSRSFIAPGEQILRAAIDAGCWNIIGNPSAVLMRAVAASAFDGRYRQFPDWRCWIDILCAWSYSYIDITSCRYRRHVGQASHTNSSRHAVSTELERLQLLTDLDALLLHKPELQARARWCLRKEAWKSTFRLAFMRCSMEETLRPLKLAGPRVIFALPPTVLELLRSRLVKAMTRHPPRESRHLPSHRGTP